MSKLYPCVNCTEDGYCKKYSDEEVKSWCVQGPCKDERPSNADRIRNMTDEELAKLFIHNDTFFCPKSKNDIDYCKKAMFVDGCRNCFSKWLKQEGE